MFSSAPISTIIRTDSPKPRADGKSLADKVKSSNILNEIDGSKHAPIELILDL